ncbi:MAG: TonB-dependent receptor plug domain-containing protein [Bacteroidales bacterium]|jgi:iron complex outermembrane receptor protein
MKNSKKILVLAGIIAGFQSYSQKTKFSDTVKIKEVTITSTRLQNYTVGNKIQTIDSAALKNNATYSLSELISSQTQVQINSYGPGAQASPSFRGSGAAHTAVLWNGFNIQDVLFGSIDFSQIPGFFLDEVKIQAGGAGALYGSGAIGGAINLNNNLFFNKGLKTSFITSYGSFSNYFNGAECRISEKKFSASVKVFDHSMKNDFEYSLNGAPKQKLINSATKQQGALIDYALALNEKQKLTAHIWFNNNEHKLPFDSYMMPGKAIQTDNSIRRTIEWNRIDDKSEFFLRTAYFNNYQKYDDIALNSVSNYNSSTSITEFENNYKFSSSFKLNSGLNYTHDKGESPNLDNTHIRDRSTIFSSLKYNTLNNKFKTVLSLREEIVNSIVSPLTYSFGFDGEIIKGLNLKGNVNKSYRIPTFNDLYWFDPVYMMFGNPKLKDEEGLNEELSLNYNINKKNILFEVGATGFNSNVSNWILWQPVENSFIWTPMNVDTVWSRGVEFNFNFEYKTGSFFAKLSGMYTVLKTTNESKLADSTIKNKQLIYVPENKAVANLVIGYKRFAVTYSHNYIGKRFADAANTTSVDEYNIGNVILSKVFVYKDYDFTIDFHINNVWAQSYQVMQYYPMPGRNYQIGLKINFNKPNNK